jgi:hypothetical protein
VPGEACHYGLAAFSPPKPLARLDLFVSGWVRDEWAQIANTEETMADATETIRRQRLAEINAESADHEALASKYGRVWNTAELCAEFDVLGFMAPYVVVQRKTDGCKGSLEFQHSPRLYFNFVADAA